MGDSYGDPQKGRSFDGNRDGGRAGFRGGRGGGNREGGGFRIRLSDNEMKASRAIQEAFNLRSTVAVLGFAIRTLGQLLEEGKLDEFLNEYRSNSPRGAANNNQPERNGGSNNYQSTKKAKPNPFARPSKPESQLAEPIQDGHEESSKEKELNTESSIESKKEDELNDAKSIETDKDVTNEKEKSMPTEE
ncbi:MULTISPECIES: hypothetical protein [Prochlorococcus]|uniref:Uncharacterized protein n=1 Tax=Prochlorococcus marinus (strain SARG / CCMP1375 / SS120) TaxID=167539 RepID=Q7VBN0_PROMA|nr:MULTISPECIES: hypothetical protein [Prochlorococcus]AAQ00107.1 Predicted protein [Prochlorococcus marinus subsp. marinus str. CCMP1375]KGG13903.1 hypothetical protein EV04_0388 [Prochlorococcus marinus str. LG]KGG19036.1 hypothetical protein EV08_1523 [Prochlorococcus marinus str. SS2]KGG23424.1 hypothetical protein EV09_1048 [Prochlorococcus marinus str. SS35]KGG32340.1 hypothetical protein EV10_1455 [Prochlorococcus marinus str. SS51]